MENKLTVIVMTYNQADYIRQCLDSILCQKVNIDFNVLVHDDCSNDGTYEILLDYQNKFNNIHIIHENERQFIKLGFNKMIFKYVVPLIDSKYVAYCDGDDYWCDEYKLQKQYDFMETHKDYSMCFHCAYQLRKNNDLSSKWFIDSEGDIDMSDLVNDKPGIKVATSSIFLKSEVFKEFPDWRLNFPVEDVPMYMVASLNGKIHRLKDIMCVYRQFSIGSWSSQNTFDSQKRVTHLKKMIESTNEFNEATNYKYDDLVKKQILGCEFRINYLNKDFPSLFEKKYKHLFSKLSAKEKISFSLQYRTPKLYNLICKRGKQK